jgi:hypothetical protein
LSHNWIESNYNECLNALSPARHLNIEGGA